MKPFTGSFTQQEAIADEAIADAVAVLRSGRLHRYNSAAGEPSVVSRLEAEFAAYQGARYCLACASGGYALTIALRAAGVVAGDPVLTNAFTLAPVPGAIAAAGATPVLVEATEDLVIDRDDLERKLKESRARTLLLSNMRGHLADMDAIVALAERHGVTLIEDCAHTMGATWNGRKSGSFGLAGCFSTQTYKHLNSGEGGLLTSDDEAFMARAVMMSGSYMFYDRHGAAPGQAAFDTVRLETPNMSGRMDNLRAAILLPQLRQLEKNIARWNERYRIVADVLANIPGIRLPTRPAAERFVGSSIQFLLPGIDPDAAAAFVAANKALGVELKWFGAAEPAGFTSTHHSWQYMAPQDLPATDRISAGLFDMRLPLTFSLDDCRQVASIIAHCARQTLLKGAA